MKISNYLTIIILSILFNNLVVGQINFAGHEIDTEINGITGIQSCDIDGDGDNDIIATSTNSDKVVFYRNDGGMPVSFTKFYVDENFKQALYVYCADINNDSRPDVLASSSGAGVIAWWKNNGDDPLTWTKQVIVEEFKNCHGVNICDIDNDGNMDIVATAAGANTIAWWKNDGNENNSWTKNIITDNFLGTQSVYTSDIDNDGDMDVMGAAAGNNQIALWINNGGNPIEWEKQTLSNSFNIAHWVYASDVDGDGLTDILGAAYTISQIAWWKNNGGDPITWIKYPVNSLFLGAVTVHAEDLDNDGDIDVIGTAWAGDDIAVWLNQGGTPVKWKKITVDYNFNGAWPVITSDLDNDGDVDIITGADVLTGPGTSAPLTWWENDLITGIEDKDIENNPTGFELKQNYPNPFNPSTQITYAIAKDSNTKLIVYDITGREINKLVDEFQTAGTKTVSWNGDNNSGDKINSGVYIVKLSSGNYSSSKKMVLLR